MHKETLAQETAKLFARLGKDGNLRKDGFYLAGGTALALHLGHRQSIDLDFFTKERDLPKYLLEYLESVGKFKVVQQEDRTLHAILNGVRISFISFPYPLLYPLLEMEGVMLADERDIATMKISAISGRGAKKDFIDLYVLLQKYSLEDILADFERKFAGREYSRLHILKSISYFDDANAEDEPVMLARYSWADVKNKLTSEAKRLAE
ncbi:nucleotidyl transferase AbiEii/AbiGii toxin family protein [Candidatus Kaiserbacteria bacterium]|nr:nucleotidyl transferase AbiEii/AbiGii toxin family protein [Candidatus Kaiserbacteria bacterium]